jgi:hypothetical protein
MPHFFFGHAMSLFTRKSIDFMQVGCLAHPLLNY